MGTIVFKTRAGATALRYGQLSAQDSTGTRLPTAMLLRNGVLELRIDDRRARYPLRIDPFSRSSRARSSPAPKRALGTSAGASRCQPAVTPR